MADSYARHLFSNIKCPQFGKFSYPLQHEILRKSENLELVSKVGQWDDIFRNADVLHKAVSFWLLVTNDASARPSSLARLVKVRSSAAELFKNQISTLCSSTVVA